MIAPPNLHIKNAEYDKKVRDNFCFATNKTIFACGLKRRYKEDMEKIPLLRRSRRYGDNSKERSL